MNARAASFDQPTADTAGDDLAEGFSRHLVQWAEQAGASADSLPVLAAAARLSSLATQAGHVCARLDELTPAFPDQCAGELRRRLLASGMVSQASQPDVLPLVIDDGDRLYLYRYFSYERRLAASLQARVGHVGAAPSDELRRQLDRLFAANAQSPGDRPDWQKLAAALAWRGRLTIISGGPGTGKTTTVAKLLVMHAAAAAAEGRSLAIRLAAPTGKAAARVGEALAREVAALARSGQVAPQLLAQLPISAQTLHRLLGAGARGLRHDAANPLAADVVVLDESSMVDLRLLDALLAALPRDARLLLLGDRDQLAAVEAGNVFLSLIHI